MNLLPFSSWTRKKLVLVFVGASIALASVLLPLANWLLLGPAEMQKWKPTYEESYWVPAQVQIAVERLATELALFRMEQSNIESVRVRLAVLKSKLVELRTDSDVGRMFAAVQGSAAASEELDTFIQTAQAHLETPTRPNVDAILSDIAALRPLMVELASNARGLETEAKLGRDMEIRKNRHMLMSATAALLAAFLLVVWVVLQRLLAREKELLANRALLDARQTALDEALRAENARNTFLGKVSHEIHSPLQAILTNVQVMEERYQHTTGLDKLVGRLKTSVTQLRAQVQDLLDVSEIKNGKLSLKLDVVDLKAVFEDVVAVQQTSADNKNLGLVLSCAGLLPVRTDGHRLSQILTNLLTNAIRNTDHGTIRVKAELGMDDHKAMLVLAVRDTGVGIPPEVQEHLFQPFMRASNSRRGTGLGLAIVKGLVDQLDGDITYETAPGRGTAFTVTLPVHPMSTGGPGAPTLQTVVAEAQTDKPTNAAAQAPGHAHPGARETDDSGQSVPRLGESVQPRVTDERASPTTAFEPESFSRPGAKVLFLEDDVAIRETLGDLLTESGYAVDIASTVKQAEESLVEEQYDCLILDMELPDGTGLEAAQFAKKTRNFATPVMAVSAYHDLLSKPGTEIFSAALKKPVTLEELRRTLNACLQSA
jgi:signal transduction histidine kinase